MDLYTINFIKSNPNLYNYLRENSSWYKYLNRSASYLKNMEDEMKQKYKLTAEDRLAKFSDNIKLISSFIDVLK